MNIEELEKKTLADLRVIAKVMDIKSITKYRKKELIEKIVEKGKGGPETKEALVENGEELNRNTGVESKNMKEIEKNIIGCKGAQKKDF